MWLRKLITVFSCDVKIFRNQKLPCNRSEVLVSSDVKPSYGLPFYNVLALQDFSFCYRGRLNFQVFALRDIKVVAREAFASMKRVIITRVFAN